MRMFYTRNVSRLRRHIWVCNSHKESSSSKDFFIALSAILPFETQPESERESEKETEDSGKQLGFLSRMASKAEGRERERYDFLWRIWRRNINSKRSCWDESHETSELKKKKNP